MIGKTEYIDITPHRSIMLKLGNSGYSLTEAIAELVDNSIDARVEGKKLNIKISIGKEIVIEDNGFGMSKEDAASSIRLGFSKKKKLLGMFGLGLKTACSSMGEKFSIYTSTEKDKFAYFIEYSEKKWLDSGSWTKYPMQLVKKTKLFTGTIIKVNNLRINTEEKEVARLMEEFSKRFAPFLENNLVEIKVNNKLCKPYIINLTVEGKHNINIKLPSGNKVTGWYGFKMKDTMGDYFGFNTYRLNRLISTFDKFAISSSQKDKQIIGELHMDHVPVTHNKRDWIRESKEFKEVKKKLIDYMKDFDTKLQKIVSGLPASGGRVEGIAVVIDLWPETPIKELDRIKPGSIIVTGMTRPQFILQIQRASAIVTDQGGALCHAAIVAREFGIPAIVGTRNATERIRDGQKIIVDAYNGVVYDGE